MCGEPQNVDQVAFNVARLLTLCERTDIPFYRGCRRAAGDCYCVMRLCIGLFWILCRLPNQRALRSCCGC